MTRVPLAARQRGLAIGAERSAVPVLRRTCACDGSERDCGCGTQGVLRRTVGGGGAFPTLVPPIVHAVLGSAGEPLDGTSRRLMEAKFNHDFSRVRVHTDGRAAQSARAVDALAYTVGSHVVFGRGAPSSTTIAGRRLLAHELAHVVQQGGFGGPGFPVPATLAVGHPDDPAEGHADRSAERAMSDGLPPLPARLSGSTPVLRRAVLNNVVTDFQVGAQACVVHVHGEEHTALAVGKEIRSRRCVNFMHLDTSKRYVDFEFTESGVAFAGQADPNRIFTPAGRSAKAILEIHRKPGEPTTAIDVEKVRAGARKVLQEFADNKFIPKFTDCRAGGAGTAGPLPVMALHNNEGLLPDVKVASTSRAPNPAKGDPKNPSDFILATRAADFDALKSSYNVILQEDPVQTNNDDGSLSVLLSGSRYVNVEKEGRQHDKPTGPAAGLQLQDNVYLKQYNMAAEVLTQFGVSQFPCFSSAEHEPRTRSLYNRRLGNSGRRTTAMSGDAPVLNRDELPDKDPPECRLFRDQAALDRRADEWRAQIERIPLLNILHWVLGGADFVPAEPLAEFGRQQKCLIAAMRKGVTAAGLVTPAGDVALSTRRTSADQQNIWKQKFDFTAPKPFDRISDFARQRCTPALGTDQRWDPKNKDHQQCWNKLTPDERQKEILMASSAPGVSRHHAGVDFDFGKAESDLDPKAWTGKGRFADSYRWLARNASAFGFTQPFDTKGGYGVGYMSERWHWSYYPVAQAVMEFVMDHEVEVEAALNKLWSDGKGGIKPEFSFIAKNWRKYLYNVEQEGVF